MPKSLANAGLFCFAQQISIGGAHTQDNTVGAKLQSAIRPTTARRLQKGRCNVRLTTTINLQLKRD
jgi:hypothetical protein